MEICTYIVNGELTHKDSMGTQETLGRGSIQFITAGTGVQHSEHNLHPQKPLRFIQIWIVPRQRGLKPNYGGMCGGDPKADRKNKLAHLVSDVADKTCTTPVKINQDGNIYVAEMDAGLTLPFTLGEGRQAYMLSIEGSVAVTGPAGVKEELEQHAAARVQGEATLQLTSGRAGAHVLIVEMAK
jgi:redox-sensitive bicupin YhaK (pirin superfamily)